MRADNALPNAHTFAGVFTAASWYFWSASVGQQSHTLAIKTARFYWEFSSQLLLLEARKLFDKMPERNAVSWATMISGYGIQRVAVEALGLFELMQSKGEGEDNEFVFTSLLSALVVSEIVNSGRQIHGLAVRNGLLSFVSLGNALVTMYAKCESMGVRENISLAKILP